MTDNKNRVYYIAGIDTGIGKTLTTGLLAKYYMKSGYSVITQKPVQTGCDDFSEDIRMHREIMGTQKALAPFGIRPLAYRPPVGITTPGLGRVLGPLGMYTVNFRFRTFDRGNRRLRSLARFTLERVRPDDILVLHDLNPHHDQGIARWLVEVKRIVTGLRKKGLAIVPLEALIGRPVMERAR